MLLYFTYLYFYFNIINGDQRNNISKLGKLTLNTIKM